VTPEAARYLEKAGDCLKNARAELDIGIAKDAGRNAYMANFHAAQAFIFHKTGKVPKRHAGVHREFERLMKDCSATARISPGILVPAYDLKADACYRVGPESTIQVGRARDAIENAESFVTMITELLSASK